MREVCDGLRDTLQRHRVLVISVAAGLTAETLQSWLGGELPLVRCMPNTPSLVGAGAAGLFATAEVSAQQRTQAGELLAAVGLVEWVEEESLLDAITAVSGRDRKSVVSGQRRALG